MDWPQRQQQGFALAAAAHGDTGAALAMRGLVSSVAERAVTEARRIASAPRDLRRSWVRDLLGSRDSSSQIQDHQAARPPRALGLLASSVDKALGRCWLERAPMPRAGYVPDPRLLSLLRKLAVRSH